MALVHGAPFGKTSASYIGSGVSQERGSVMTPVIEFYIPTNFRRKVTPVPQSEPGKVIEFYPPEKKSA